MSKKFSSEPVKRHAVAKSGRSLLAKAIARELGVSFLQAYSWVNFVIDQIIQELLEKKSVKIQGFGVFEVYKRKGRKLKHPVNGHEIQLPDMWWVRWRSSNELKKRFQRFKPAEIFSKEDL